MRWSLIILASAVATQAQAAGSNAQGRARTLQSIAMTAARDLDFGTLIIATTAGTASINPRTDARTRTGGVTLAPGGSAGAARFTINGTPNAPVQITIGALPTLVRVGGTETMAVNRLTLNGGRNRNFSAAGGLDVRVGGRLAVPANQVAGAYAGTFTVTVDYR
jgi:Mat/Ecp fimbriae major subunit